MCKNFEIFIHTGITLYETILSFLIVNVISILLAILLLSFNTLSKITEPYLVILNSLPKSALAPLIIVWLGTGSKTIIVAGISVAVFGSIINLYTGFLQVDKEKLKLIRTLGGTKKDELLKVIVPSSVPIIISNMKVNIGLSLVGVIIGEFLAARHGLGYLIIYGSQIFQLDLLILSIIILCVIALMLYKSIDFLEKRYKK
jgi:NitT/TauT family transport system permease protein